MSVTLTVEQRAAVENRGGQLLVSAAAGSGKTKVLVERLFRYVEQEGKNIDDFLIITYTKAAAAELRGKIAAELSERVGADPGNDRLRRQMLRVYQADIKTVDSFCTALLRENTHLLARDDDKYALTPDFRVLDEPEAVLLRERVLRRCLETFYETLTPGREFLADAMGAGVDDKSLAKLALSAYDKLQSHAWPLRWLEASRKAWEDPGDDFDATPYAAELLSVVRRRAAHWRTLLQEGARRTAGDEKLRKGYGDKFLTAAAGMDALSRVTRWDSAAQVAELVTFPRVTTPKGRAADALVVSLKQVWDNCKDGLKALRKTLGVSGADAMSDLTDIAPAMSALLELVADFSEQYRLEKLRLNVADFADQEHLALRLLVTEDGRPTETGRQVAARYTEILVDEYQDTNDVQNAIFRAVSRDGQNLFVVGDVKQSIYRFRLADPTIFLRKYAAFAPCQDARDGQDRKILLSRNFRSRSEILDAVNFVFTNILSPEMGEMTYGPEESLYFGADYYPPRADCDVEFHLIDARRRGPGDEPDAPPVRRLTAEARFVARRIRELLDGGFPVTGPDGALRPCRPEDIVILMRSPRSRTAAFFQALSERNVPCSFDESGGFFDTMEVATAFALLQIVDNPRQDVPFIAVLRSPVFAFTADRLAEIRARHPDGDFYDAVRAAAGLSDDAREPEGDCVAFLDTLSELRRAALDMGVYEFYCFLCVRLNLSGLFGAMDAGPERQENLLTLGRHAERFEQNGYRGLFAFVTQMRRLVEAGRVPDGQSGAHSGVRLMSIHKSKGLEFPVVILADLDRAFSRQDFKDAVLVHPELGLGPRYVDLKRRIRYPTLARVAVEARLRRENLSEEQRILYVAMTRAKEKLILVDAAYHVSKKLQKFAALTGNPAPPESVAEGKSFGDWLLLSLLTRPEASPLWDAAGTEPASLWRGPDAPWTVAAYDAETFRDAPDAASATPSGVRDAAFRADLLSWAYPYRVETLLPAKVTATQLKGRPADAEISEGAARVPTLRPLSQPKFRWGTHGLTPAERGTAAHLLLQHLDLDGPSASVQAARLVERRLLTPEQADAIDFPSVDRFLSSPLADDIRHGRNVRREYRFTLLMDAAAYEPRAASGDTLLLQGVVDCCFETDDGITVVDFKTDAVRGADVARRAEAYRPQLRAYSDALERVLGLPVVRRALYFLHSGATADV